MPLDVGGSSDPWNAFLGQFPTHAVSDEPGAPPSSPWDGGDSVSSSMIQRILSNFLADHPVLTPPKEQSSNKSFANTTANKTSSAPGQSSTPAVSTNKTSVPGTTKSPGTPEDNPADQTANPLDVEFTHNVANLVNEGLKAAGYAGAELTQESRLANYYLENPDAPVPAEDEALKKIISSAQQTAQKNIKAENPGTTWTAPTGGNPAKFNAVFNRAVDNALKQLQKTSKPPLTKAQVAQLKFAVMNPSVAGSALTSSANMAQLQKMIPTYLAHAGPGYAVPDNFQPDATAYNATIASNYNSNFEVELAKYSDANDLTPAQENELRTMHYAPSLSVKDQTTLAPILSQLEQSAMADTNAKMNIPSSVPSTWRPAQSGSDAAFQGRIQKDYQKNNETNISAALQAAKPPLTTDQIAQLRQVVADPADNEGIPQNIIDMANGITQKSLGQTNGNFNLVPGSWAPSAMAGGLWSGSQVALNAATYIGQMQSSLQNVASQIPNGPAKQSLLNLLAMISRALSDLQSSVYAMESQDAQAQANQQYGIKDSMDSQIAIRAALMAQMQQQEQAMYAKQAKANKMSGIMKIVGPIVIALSVLAAIASFGAMSGLAIAVTCIMIGIMIHDQVDPNHSVMGALTNKIAEGLVDAGMSKEDASIVASVIVVVIVVVVMGGAGMAGAASSASGAADAAAAGTDAATAGGASTASSLDVAGQEGASSAANSFEVEGVDGTQVEGADDGQVEGAGDGQGPEGQVQNDAEVDDEDVDDDEDEVDEDEPVSKEKLEAEIKDIDEDLEATEKDEAGEKADDKEENEKTEKQEKEDASKKLKQNIEKAGKIVKIGAASLNTVNSGMGLWTSVINLQIAEIQGTMAVLKAAADASDTHFDDTIQAQQNMVTKILHIISALTKWNESISTSEAKLWQDARAGQWV